MLPTTKYVHVVELPQQREYLRSTPEEAIHPFAPDTATRLMSSARISAYMYDRTNHKNPRDRSDLTDLLN
jgi:hypothetical protein